MKAGRNTKVFRSRSRPASTRGGADTNVWGKLGDEHANKMSTVEKYPTQVSMS